MNVADENLNENQLKLLRTKRIRLRQIGVDLGRLGMSDDAVIPLLHELGSVTFFTCDIDYYQSRLCHLDYCLVYLDVETRFLAATIQEFLRHPKFRTWARRSGKVVRVRTGGLRFWSLNAKKEELLDWPDQ